MYEFRYFFSQGSNQQYSIIGLDNDFAPNHYLNQWWLDYRHIYASLDLNELSLIISKT